MKAIIQIAFAFLVANAAYQTASSYWHYYKLEEDVREEILHGRMGKFSELHQRVVELADAYDIEIPWENIQVSHRQDVNEIDVQYSYVDNVAFVPRVYVRPWKYESTVGTRRMRALAVDEGPNLR